MIYTDKIMSPEKAVEYMTDDWIKGGNSCGRTLMDLRDELKKHLSKNSAFGKSTLIEMIYATIQVHGSQHAVAQAWGISDQYLSDVYRGKREPGAKILDGLDLIKVVSYIERS